LYPPIKNKNIIVIWQKLVYAPIKAGNHVESDGIYTIKIITTNNIKKNGAQAMKVLING